jgi:hypothetical protein
MTNPTEGRYNIRELATINKERMVIPIQEKAKNIIFLFSKDLKWAMPKKNKVKIRAK